MEEKNMYHEVLTNESNNLHEKFKSVLGMPEENNEGMPPLTNNKVNVTHKIFNKKFGEDYKKKRRMKNNKEKKSRRINKH